MDELSKYPSMIRRLSCWGNYWSDYAGADRNSDQIDEVLYVIDMDNREVTRL